MSHFTRVQDSVALNILHATDERAMPTWHRWGGGIAQQRPWDDGVLWTSSRFLGGASAGPFNQDGGAYGGRWTYWWDEAGNPTQRLLIGQTLDSTGAPLGACSVVAILTSDNTPQGTVTSDSQGYYEVCTPQTANHRVDAYLAGAPDVAGTTVNNLVPV